MKPCVFVPAPSHPPPRRCFSSSQSPSMCEETVTVKSEETSQRGQDGLRLRKKDPSPRRRSLSPAPYPGAKPVTTGLYLEPHHLAGKLYRAHHTIQIPV